MSYINVTFRYFNLLQAWTLAKDNNWCKRPRLHQKHTQISFNMKKVIFLFFYFLFFITLLQAQILVENFSDGDFTQNPTWTSFATNDFIIENNRLKSNLATPNSTFFITTPLILSGGLIWEVDIELQFNPSSTNYIDVFLQSNNSNLTNINTEGYFVRIGNTDDEISLYRRKNGINTEIIDGLDNVLNVSNNVLKLKVTRDLNNLWTLERNILNTWTTEGTIQDNQVLVGNFFGILIRQSTASFVNKHFFDNITISQIPESVLPVWEDLKVIDDKKIEISFSEAVKLSTAQNLNNYSISPTIPLISIVNTTPNSFVLTFQNSFISFENYTLTIQNIEDLSGNTMITTQKIFNWIQTFEPKFHELIIAEVMIDPRGNAQPLNPLPDREYIEVYNRTAKILNLKNCKLIDDGTAYLIESETLLYPQEYALLVKNTDVNLFQSFGKVIGFTSFPSLVNSADTLLLKNAQDELLFSLNYSDAFYENTDKKDGGWSLEMIDIQNPCSQNNNWTSSLHTRGGTPARKNSVQDYRPDLTKSTLLKAEAIDEQNILLTFSENLKQNTLDNIEITISSTITITEKKWELNDDFSKIKLKLSAPITTEKYEINVNFFADCAGNLTQDNIKKIIGKPQTADSSDIIVNEILFNPKVNGVDFVELYNRSDKFINLKNYKIANKENNIYTNQTEITNTLLIIPPKSYLVLTTNTLILQSNYPNIKIENVFQCNFPSLTDEEGTFVLIDNQGKIIDDMYYHEDWHFALIDNKEGVSLERIDFDMPTQNKNSWKSASANVNFATPTFLNSQQKNTTNNNQLDISPAIFTPDQDGYQDFTTITLNQMQNNTVVSIYIYDRNGREIKIIAQNSILGTNNSFVWDGVNQQGEKVTESNYLVVVKIFTIEGGEQILRKPVVVASRF
ncbi:MAG: hypothetical protein EAZ06_05855 [Cytophagales bacterium]|nr:MAG: hypothetical protein EAZ06_05855 [Cytophagales bacterium]